MAVTRARHRASRSQIAPRGRVATSHGQAACSRSSAGLPAPRRGRRAVADLDRRAHEASSSGQRALTSSTPPGAGRRLCRARPVLAVAAPPCRRRLARRTSRRSARAPPPGGSGSASGTAGAAARRRRSSSRTGASSARVRAALATRRWRTSIAVSVNHLIWSRGCAGSRGSRRRVERAAHRRRTRRSSRRGGSWGPLSVEAGHDGQLVRQPADRPRRVAIQRAMRAGSASSPG